MSEERVDCPGCGSSILASTAERTGGVCMKCKSLGKTGPSLKSLFWEAWDREQFRMYQGARDDSSAWVNWYFTDKGLIYGEKETSEHFEFVRLSVLHDGIFGKTIDYEFPRMISEEYSQIERLLKRHGCEGVVGFLEDAGAVIFGPGGKPDDLEGFMEGYDQFEAAGKLEPLYQQHGIALKAFLKFFRQFKGGMIRRLKIPTSEEEFHRLRMQWMQEEGWVDPSIDNSGKSIGNGAFTMRLIPVDNDLRELAKSVNS